MIKWRTTSLPSMISKFCWCASKKHPLQTVVIAFDEVWAENAWIKDGMLDWSELGNLPDNVHLLLAFNPAQSLPILLPSDDDFLKFSGAIRYRNTRNIIKLTDFMMKSISVADLPEDEIASDVKGDTVKWIDLGKIRDPEDLYDALRVVADYMGPGDITFLHELEEWGTSAYAVSKMSKEFQNHGSWDAKEWPSFQGQETNRVVYLGSGASLEPLSRARVKLVLVLFWGLSRYFDFFQGKSVVFKRNDENDHTDYEKFRPLYLEAEKNGLLKKLIMPENNPDI